MLLPTICPLIEDFHIPNIIGAKERKQWIFGSNVTVAAGSLAQAVTFSSLSGKIISELTASRVLIQKLTTVPGACNPFATSKTAYGFTLNGESGASYSVVVLGTEPYSPRSTKKWAKDYCPYCKANKIDAIVGENLPGQVLFSFSHALTAGSQTVAFRSQTLNSITGVAVGSKAGPLVSLMADTNYQIIITKSSSTVITTRPYPSTIAKDGFVLHGDSGETYDILILGTILN